jgi:hypothetical protein
LLGLSPLPFSLFNFPNMKTPEQIKADLITAKLNQVNAAAEKHAAALMAYPALAAADTAARAACRAAA